MLTLSGLDLKPCHSCYYPSLVLKILCLHKHNIRRVPFFVFFCLFAISWVAPMAYGSSQARGLIGVVAAGLSQSHSKVGSKLPLQPTLKLMAMPDP